MEHAPDVQAFSLADVLEADRCAREYVAKAVNS